MYSKCYRKNNLPVCLTLFLLGLLLAGKTARAQRPEPSPACSFSSNAYNDFFKLKESYIPVNGTTEKQTVVKKIKMRFVMVNPDPNALVQTNFLPADMPKINQIVQLLNDHSSNMDLSVKPSSTCGTCHIADERIRFELTDVDFVTDPTPYRFDSSGFLVHGKYDDSILNVYFIVNPNFTAVQNGTTILMPGAISRGIYGGGIGSFPTGPGYPAKHFLVMSNFYGYCSGISSTSNGTMSFYDVLVSETRRLFHEFHHALGLGHLYGGVTCNSNDPEYLTDIFVGTPFTCPISDAINCDPNDPNSNCGNNVMDIRGWYASPIQIGQVQRNLFIGTPKRYIYPTEAPTVHPWVVDNDETWDFAIRLYQDIRVEAGATLTIKCEVQMPPNARIVVEPGAKLVVDGGIITSYHKNSTWTGIQLYGNMYAASIPAAQGSVELKNGAVIENAIEALWNFTMENGAQGGGIIQASNSHFYNCWRAVGLNGYENYTYGDPFTGITNCSFDNVTFTIDQEAPFLDAHNWDGGDMITSFDTKAGVLISNCLFKNEIPYDMQPQNKRGRAIHMAATGILVSGSTFEDFRVGINSEGYTGIPTTNTYVHDNTFSGMSNGIILSAEAYGDVRGNRIENLRVEDPSAYTPPTAIYLDNTAGSIIGCDNIINGTGGEPNPISGNVGILIHNSASVATMVASNYLTGLTRSIQTEEDNANLNIVCNFHDNNSTAWSVNPQSIGGVLHDQGNGCASNDLRAGNVFVNNQTDIKNFLGKPWYYYAFAGNNEYPALSNGNPGGNTFFLYSCAVGGVASDPNSQCSNSLLCQRRYGRGTSTQTDQERFIADYNQLVAAGMKNTAEAKMLKSEIVKGYGLLDNIKDLQTFLENENDDESNRQLIPVYIAEGNYTTADAIISRLPVSQNEQQAYSDYYNMLISLKQDERNITMLKPSEMQTIQALAAQKFGVSAYAKAILDRNNQPWVHTVEEDQHAAFKTVLSGGANKTVQESVLYNAVPNPANKTASVSVFVAATDVQKQPMLVLSDAFGKVIKSYTLKEGENKTEIGTEDLAGGLYIYSFMLQGKAVKSGKLSIVH